MKMKLPHKEIKLFNFCYVFLLFHFYFFIFTFFYEERYVAISNWFNRD
jgi:hypothetical protein